MAIDGLIILDSTGRPIIQSGFRSNSAAYPLIHVDAFATAQEKASRPGDIDPVIYVPSYNSENKPSACCHIPCGDVRFLCPVSGDVDPLFAFAFMKTFNEILHEYFGSVSAATLKDNFDVVYQLLEETLDASGHPLTTFPNALRDIVLPPSLLTKLLGAAGANLNPAIGQGPSTGAFSSPIPWRKSGVRYTSNEIYFDVVEGLKAIVNKNGTPLSTNIWGRIDANCRLSGTPDCNLTFTNPNVLVDCAFHPCVRLQRWIRDHVLSFVPPDGKFVLFDYRYLSNPGTLTGRDATPLPFAIKASLTAELNASYAFEISFISRLNTHTFDNLVGEIYLGQGAGAIKCTSSRGHGGFGNSTTEGKTSSSSWVFDSRRMVLKWEIPHVPPSSTWLLRGSFTSSSRPSRAINIRFEIASHTYSSMKVEQLKVSSAGEAYKPFKGVRGRSTCDVEWRF
ncbi:Mu homology domain-containing protein [Mycena floridula]|nr:Mu homology domain-containing protein [Mycena floridula]